MDALILTCGTGGGHDSAARAVQEELLRRGDRAVVMNPYDLHSKGTSHRINRAYISLVQWCPALFGLVYGLGNLYRKLPFRSPVYHWNRGMAKLLDEFLRENNFDIVIATHLFPAEILTQMKNQGMEVPKTVFVSTDYTCIPFTEETRCDVYVVPTQACAEACQRRGIPASKIRVLGIPVSAAFSQELTQREARKKLGLSRNRRYILLCGGSMGAGCFTKRIRNLLRQSPSDVNVIVICGSNEALSRRLREEFPKRVLVLGKTDKMAAYIRACDLYMTKPGGLSSTEAAVAGVALMHLPPIPGCETENARFFTQQGMSRRAHSGKKGAAEILALLEDETAREAMVRNQKSHILPDAAGAIWALTRELTGGVGRKDPESGSHTA